MPDYSQVGFFPVICLSASRVVPEGMEECDGYLYVQGSGDDEEMWSKGLSPDLFWENEASLLEEGITPAECEARAEEIVRGAKLRQLEKSRIQHGHSSKGTTNNDDKNESRGQQSQSFGRQLAFTPSMETCSQIKPSPIWIGNKASGRIPDSWEEGFDVVINCAAEIKRGAMFEGAEESQIVTQLGGIGAGRAQASLCIAQRHHWKPADPDSSVADLEHGTLNGKEYHYLHLPIAEGKKGQHQLLEMIPFAIRTVKSFYESRTTDETCDTRILVHCQQGMDRSVGITLALLVSCFDEESGGYCRRNTDQRHTTTKEAIQRRLFQIMSHRLAARPSRATLKMVNTYFMSPMDPPPAKHKQQS